MKIDKFEDIISWQKAKVLTILLYKTFENSKDFAFKNQLERAAVSIMNNIAEGYERQTNKEFKQFLFIAKGSSAEVRSMLYLAKDLDKINDHQFEELYSLSLEISKLISGLIKTLYS
ncbi:MAG: four helix bundle protein [Bacteroidales bacterium]|nr:four helix bundle protein [Bacteroidales bacterium]